MRSEAPVLVDAARAVGVRDRRVLAALAEVDRGRFVPEDQRGLATRDVPVSIGSGQVTTQPSLIAIMVEGARTCRDRAGARGRHRLWPIRRRCWRASRVRCGASSCGPQLAATAAANLPRAASRTLRGARRRHRGPAARGAVRRDRRGGRRTRRAPATGRAARRWRTNWSSRSGRAGLEDVVLYRKDGERLRLSAGSLTTGNFVALLVDTLSLADGAGCR